MGTRPARRRRRIPEQPDPPEETGAGGVDLAAGVAMLAGPEDPRSAGYRDLIEPQRHRIADRRPDVFVAEGIRIIRQLLEDRWPLESILLSTARARTAPDVVARAAAADVQVYCAGPDIFDRITGYHAHRGALALAARPDPSSLDSVVADARLVLVAEGVNDHENLGALFRNAAAFGVDAVVLDPATADPLYRRSVRVSLGHVLRVPFARAAVWPRDLARLGGLGFRVIALAPAADLDLDGLASGAGPIAGRTSGLDRIAVLVGSEGGGLSAAALAAADTTVRIPMASGVDSLNVATAAAVALHRIAPLVRPSPGRST